MGCCAMGTCEDPDCYLCVVLPRKFPPIAYCSRTVKDAKRGRIPCRLVDGHTGECRPQEGKKAAEKPTAKVTRDGDPKLAAARKRGNLAFQKRTRAGAQWVPPDRRV